MRPAALALITLLACSAQPPAVRPAPSASAPTPAVAVSPTASPRPAIASIERATGARMRASWRAGCPVPLDDLRILTLDHLGFDGRIHRGELIVHRDHAAGVLRVFETLLEERFAIERMRLVDEYGGDDERSMEANNTSGFNCRRSTGTPSRWSAHAYGRAIDINPVQNPYISAGGRVLPPAGKAYVDRTTPAQGMILAGDGVVQAFASIGWTWGGTFSRVKDYQHFSASGR